MCICRLLFVLPFLVVFIRGETFTMGYITGSKRRPGDHSYPRPGLTISGAISLAVSEINHFNPLLFNHTLDFIVAETYGEESESIRQTAILWTKNVSVYIGPQETCIHEARMAASFNLPMISYFCAHHETSNKQLFPTFARTRPPDTQISKSVASVLLTFNWKKVALLFSATQDRNFATVAKTIAATLERNGIEVRITSTWPETYYGYGVNPFDAIVQQSYQEARIFVVIGYYFEHLGLMVSMQQKGLFDKGEYFVVGVDIEQYEIDNPRRYFKGLLRDEIEETAQKAFRSYVGVVGSPPIGFEDFTIKVNKYMQLPPFSFPNPVGKLGGMKKVPAEGAYLYDAVYVYARALNECLSHGENPYDGRTMFKYLQGNTYLSAMGFMVHMDNQGDAEGNYTLIARQPMRRFPGEYGIYPVGMFLLQENNTDLPVLRLRHPIDWIGDGPPVDEPVCGFHRELCVPDGRWIFGSVISASFLVIVLILVSFLYRKRAYQQELDKLLWKIDFKDIEINEYTPTQTTGKTSRSLHSPIRGSQVSLNSNTESDFRYSTIYAQLCTYKGQLYAVKRITMRTIDINRDVKKELLAMKDLRHVNLNSFIGACVEVPNIYIITEYCSRGSLKDILDNEEVRLDSMFISSLVGDLVKGMIFLHDSIIKSHGNLTSTNCLVDSRWVLKIADFGLYGLKSGSEPRDDNEDFEDNCKRLLWRAPELLRNPNPPHYGTQKGDVYSFAIVVYELIGRHGPFGKTGLSPSEIIHRVVNLEDRQPPFRPQVDWLDNEFDCLRDCMIECWAEDPEQRPDFKAIRSRLSPMRKGRKCNIIDQMLSLMEKYANNLEALVDERTDQLVEEKKKTEALLYEMLPKYVADQLKRGNKVEAESFDAVSIYFSDIVGFTELSAQCTPLQVVDFLNDLYTCFDSIIENFDVYKVETIGDAYMVVSGLPIRNGNNHAGEIASMALQILDAVKKFKIRHRPDIVLQLRIGMHSGPVCAGVVGRKMPRYCLFGDTVNTASRMESNGEPLKIHCSQATASILEKLGGYTLEDRGIIKIKGKGEMRTFWLVGQDQTKVRLKYNKSEITSKPNTVKLAPKQRNGFIKEQPQVLRSSLRRPSILDQFNLTRRCSLESPKKLIRFQNENPARAWQQQPITPLTKLAGSGHVGDKATSTLLPPLNVLNKPAAQAAMDSPTFVVPHPHHGDMPMTSTAEAVELITSKHKGNSTAICPQNRQLATQDLDELMTTNSADETQPLFAVASNLSPSSSAPKPAIVCGECSL